MTKVKNLQLWCKKMTEGYRDVEVRDMAASWKSGLAFCAIIHKFRPDLIDYDSLSKENVFENNQLAFEVAEKQLNIPAFLEASDMVAIRVPDKLSIVTYVSQYYNYFHNKPQLGGPGVNKFGQSGKKKDTSPSKSHSTVIAQDGTSQPQKDRQVSMGDKCSICHEKVYLLERHIENSRLYHRSCFRKSDLSPTSKVFKRHPNGTSEDDKSLLSTKQRKIDTEKSQTKMEDSGVDFWQRRAELKAKEAESKKAEVAAGKPSSISSVDQKSDVQNIPLLKKALEKRDIDTPKKSDVGKKGDKEWMDNSEQSNESSGPVGKLSGDTVTPTQPKTTGLAEKFRKLQEQNLKNMNDGKGDFHVKPASRNDKSTAKSSDSKKLNDEKSRVVPFAKPRQTKLEPMEVETNVSPVIKPVPVRRAQVADKDVKSPRAAPRKTETRTKSPPLLKKSDLTRPKTPPQSGGAELSLNLAKPADNCNDVTPSSPPPLPSSSPPKLQPHTVPSKDTYVRGRPKKAQNEVSTGLQVPPAKPPRASADLDKLSVTVNIGNDSSAVKKTDIKTGPQDRGRSKSPMECVEAHAAPKTVVKGQQDEHTTVLVQQNKSDVEKKNREVFGGLLKSLADVRKNYDADSKSKSAEDISSNTEPKDRIVTVVNNQNERTDKAKIDLKKRSPVPRRPKSSFISQSSNLFDDKNKESHVKLDITKKITTTTVVTTVSKNGKEGTDKNETMMTVTKREDTVGDPEWKRQLKEQRKDKTRPKSADILDEKLNLGDVPLWKIEAERRKEARQGGYVDPEKNKVDQNKSNNSSQLIENRINLSRPLSPNRKRSEDAVDKYKEQGIKQDNNVVIKSKSPERRKIPFVDDKEKPTQTEQVKKKIPVAQKFIFDDAELKEVKLKPARPLLPPSPKSEKDPVQAPGRPPPPKAAPAKPTLRHISPFEIQTKLQEIDGKLTELELKGRTLEDSIRNASDAEEDELMIAWFELVNEKNDLVRRECDYIYVSRQQELELEQHHIDQQLRVLVDKPDKTEEDMKEEEYLVEKLVDIVNQRSKIVDSIDEDRLRYQEEDLLIEAMLQQKGYLKDCKHGGYKKDKKKV